MIANATGCTSIYGGSFPSSPYTTLPDGSGPAWAYRFLKIMLSLALGCIGYETARDRIQTIFADYLETMPKALQELAKSG